MGVKTKEFDLAEHLKGPEEIRTFLQEVTATRNDSDFIHALNISPRTYRMTEVAKKGGSDKSQPLQVSCCERQFPIQDHKQSDESVRHQIGCCSITLLYNNVNIAITIDKTLFITSCIQ